MEAYSLDLRQRVLAACDAGRGTKQVAELFNVSPAWVRRLKQRRRELNTIHPLPRRYGPKPKIDQAGRDRLRELVTLRPDATLAELRDQMPTRVCLATIWNILQDLQLSLKKKRSTPPSKTAPMSRRSASSGTSNSKE